MKTQTMLKSLLFVLVVALAVTVTSWLGSEANPAKADGGGGSASGEWMMVASTLREGEGLIYVVNTKREVLLVYSYHRGRKTRDDRQFTGDLQFLAGRHMKWDVLYCQLLPYPTVRSAYKDMLTPAEVQKLFERVSRAAGGDR